jgi:acetyl-CoA carboxylase biotin carboxyl carrier protein
MDIEELKSLIAFMNENDLVELELEEGGKKVRLVKTGGTAGHVLAVPAGFPAMAAGQPGTPAAEAAPAAPAANIQIIKAPMVGTLYRAASPDSDPFADVGSLVNQETVVCIIEAMKVMNEIRAEVVGRVVEVLIENGHPVEYGQPLFKVELEE